VCHSTYCCAQNPEVTSRIRKIFNSQEGLTGLVKQLPLDQRFQLMNVKSVSVEPNSIATACVLHQPALGSNGLAAAM
jgi:hypothetical protein